MKIHPLFALLSLSLISAGPLAAAALDTTIVANDAMKFSVTRLEAHPGDVIHVLFKNAGTVPKEAMGHNWILLKAGKDANAYAMAAMTAAKEDYQPKARADDVVAAIPLLGPGQAAEMTFTVPAAPGHYPYLCTFPGHFMAGMKGELIVR